MKTLLTGIACIGTLALQAVETLPGWRSDFAACTNEAITANIPLVMVWGNKFCSHCEALEDDLQRESFTKWKTDKEYIFCFVEGVGVNGQDPDYARGAKDFAGTAGQTKTAYPSRYPFVTVYWEKADGTISATRFTTESALSVAKAAEQYFEGWTPKKDPDKFSFLVSDKAFDRLEAVESTGYVDVPVVREIITGGVATNTIVATWPDSSAITNRIVWGASETQKFARVSLDRGAKAFPAGNTMELALFDAEDEKNATGAIHFIEEPANSVLNAKWIGEDFDYGEWTMDYEAAKAKDGYTLAMFSGVLWCPYCYGMETSLLASEEFTAWAKEKKVSLVLFDQSRASSPATSAGSGLARLLGYEAGSTTTREGGVASGAGYLSRKCISREDAKSVIDSVTRLTEQWLAPGATAARLGNPTVLLVKNDKVLGRLTSWRNSDKVYDVAENIGRLNDLLLLANGDGDAGDYVQTAERTITSGQTQDSDFQINDRTECFKLGGDTEGVWRFSITNATKDAGISISLCTATNVLASGEGSLERRITADEADDDLFIRLTAYGDTYEKVCSDGSSSAFAAGLMAEKLPEPGTLRFSTGDITVFETETNIAISVTRTGGSYGEVSVVVTTEATPSNNRWTWSDTTLTWADGESGIKSATLAVHANNIYEGLETMEFSLSQTDNSTAIVSDGTITVTIGDSDKPSFEKASYTISTWATFAADSTIQIVNMKGSAKPKLTLISGKLPEGVKLSYDKSTRSVVIGGTAKTPGTYTVGFTVTENQNGTPVTGEPSTITFTVAEPKAANPMLGKARATQTMMLCTETPSGDVVAGKLAFKFSSGNQILAKFAGTESTVYSFSGRWRDIDPETGAALATLQSGATTLVLALGTNGVVSAEVEAPASSSLFADSGSITLYGDIAEPATGVFALFAGRYTVQLPVSEPDETRLNSGSACLILNMSSADAISSGKMSYSGMLPNGATISGSSKLECCTEIDEDGFPHDYARLPIFVRTGSATFGAMLRITPNASKTWLSPLSSIDLPTVAAAEDTVAYSVCRKSGDYEPLYHDVYGSYYKGGLTIEALCGLFNLNTEFSLVSGIEGFESERFGEVTAWPTAALTAKGKSFSLVEANSGFKGAYSSNSGIVKFKAQIAFGATKRTCVFVGVLLPGWVDCNCGEGFIERPFAAGTVYFNDQIMVDGKWTTVRRSVPMELQVAE